MNRQIALQEQPSSQRLASSTLQRKCACGQHTNGGGQCAGCSKEHQMLQRAPLNREMETQNSGGVPAIVHEVLRSPGVPLDTATRTFFEPRFGHDFSRVRVHTDAKAAQSARTVNALAYTVGRNIVLQPGYYKPESTEGKRLLAHELTHVVQQGQGAKRMQRAEMKADSPVEVTHLPHPMLSRIDPPYPGVIGRCRSMGVPCPAPHFHHGTVCRLVSCSRAATANLPFAISPGICIYQCSDGQVCTCVLFGNATSAVCVITLCDSAARASTDPNYEGLTTRAVALAQQQLENAPAEAEGRPGPTMQAKLEIGESGNLYEREADAVAEKVMRMPNTEPHSQPQCASGTQRDSFGGCVGGSTNPMSQIRSPQPHERMTLRRLSISSLNLPENEEQSETNETEAVQTPPEEEGNGTLQAKPLPGYLRISAPNRDSSIKTLETGIVVQRVPSDVSGSRRRSPGADPMNEDTPTVRQRGGTLPHREATELSRCLQIMGEANAEYCRQEVLGEGPSPPPPPVVCEPNRPLTWADFQGTPAPGTFAAETRFHFDFATENNRQIIRAFFDSGASWVRPRIADPTNRAVNGCAPQVAACRRLIRPGGTRRLGSPLGCAASISPNTALNATTSSECETVLGTECDRVAPLESARVLRHEQLHFSIACVLAQKGTDALFIRPASQAQTIIRAVRTKANQLSSSNGQYDRQSAHGCNAAGQADWETRVQNNLPTVTIP